MLQRIFGVSFVFVVLAIRRGPSSDEVISRLRPKVASIRNKLLAGGVKKPTTAPILPPKFGPTRKSSLSDEFDAIVKKVQDADAGMNVYI